MLTVPLMSGLEFEDEEPIPGFKSKAEQQVGVLLWTS